MEQINLSTHGKDIQKAYEQIVRGDGSATWVIYGPDSSKAYKVVETGADFEEFLESFDESQIQFGLARVNPPGSDVQKNLLVGWCPDSAPLKPRSSFAQNFAEVSKLLKGYHVQITARDSDDLDKNELLSRLSAAAGARYSIQSSRSNASPSLSNAKPSPVSRPIAPKSVSQKPAVSKPTPTSTPRPVTVVKSEPKITKPSASKSPEDEDEWNEPEVQERDFEKAPLKPNTSAWKPIGRVNLQDVIKEEKSRPDPRLEIEQLKQKDKLKKEQEIEDYLKAKPASFSAKAPAPVSSFGYNSEKLVGGISKSFGAENGKTPAQLWAEKKQRAAGSSPFPQSETKKDDGNAQQDEEQEQQEDVADLKSKFDKLTSDAEAQEKADRIPPSPGLRNAYPSKAPVKNAHDFEENPAPKLSNLHSPGAENAFLAKEEEGKEEEQESEPEAEPEQEEEEEGEQESEPEAEPEQEEDEEEEGPAPSLPSRSQVPPPPTRPEPEATEEPEEEASTSAFAEYDYEASEDNELTFNEGDRIINIEFIDEDWWLGELATGERGLFPANYVTLEQ